MLGITGRILFVAWLAASLNGPANAAAEKRVALVIGNAAYANITQLAKSVNDAHAVATSLKGLGFEVILGTNASKLELDKLTQDFRVAVKGADVGLFYYSGHGFQTNRAEQQHPVNHVVPVDFSVEKTDAKLATLALDTIVDTLKSESRVGLIFMDACRNDPQLAAASERLASGSKTVMISRGFSPISVGGGIPMIVKPGKSKGPTGLLIAYATDPGNVAVEGDKGQLSPFTTALVKHIVAPGVSIAEVMGRVSTDVSLETQGQQTPWSVSSLTAGTFRFLASLPVASDGGRASGASGRSRDSVGVKRTSSGARGSNLPPNVGAGVGAGF